MGTKFRRTSTLLAGLTLASAAVLGMANPASAATTDNAVPRAHTSGWGGWDDNDYEFRGFYNSRWSCERAGRWETRHSSDDYVCERSYSWRGRWGRDWRDDWNDWGYRHGVWALYVED